VENSSWLLVALVGWALGLLILLIVLQVAGVQERATGRDP